MLKQIGIESVDQFRTAMGDRLETALQTLDHWFVHGLIPLLTSDRPVVKRPLESVPEPTARIRPVH